jgi:hypothetical protein
MFRTRPIQLVLSILDFYIALHFIKKRVFTNVLVITYVHPMMTACSRNMYCEEVTNNSALLLHIYETADVIHRY